MCHARITTPTELESKVVQYLDSLNGCTTDYKRTESLVSTDKVYVADFETSSLPNYERFGRVHVWLWSLVNVDTRAVHFGWGVEDFLNTVRKVGAKIVYFP